MTEVKKNITVEMLSFEIKSLVRIRFVETRSPAILSPAITACVYCFGNIDANPGRSSLLILAF